jgi:proteic killer suppression protein
MRYRFGHSPGGSLPESYRLHELKGNQAGVWAVVADKNWRVTFRFEGGNAHDVGFVDYH